MSKLDNGERKLTGSECNAKLRNMSDALYVIGGKWKLRIIVALTDKNRRFNELQRLVEGISAKVLSMELKDLELNGFVKRIVFPETPVVIEYELTPYAATLQGVLHELSSWGEKHREKIKESMSKRQLV